MKNFYIFPLLLWLLFQNLTHIQAQEVDPHSQCIEGIKLFEEGKNAEALPMLEAGFTKRDELRISEPFDLGRCSLALGILKKGNEDWEEALKAYIEAKDRFIEVEEMEWEGLAFHNIGIVYELQEDYEAALVHYTRDLEIQRELKNESNEGAILFIIGNIYQIQNRYQEALETYMESLNISHSMNDRLGEGKILKEIAQIHQYMDQYDFALSEYEKALEILYKEGDQKTVGVILNNMGQIYEVQGRFEKAMEHYEQALDIVHQVGDQKSKATVLHNMGVIYHSQGLFDQAIAKYEASLAISRAIGDQNGAGNSLNKIASVYSSQGDDKTAISFAEEALAIHKETGDLYNQALTLITLADIHKSIGWAEDSLTNLEEALEIIESIHDQSLKAKVLTNIASVNLSQGYLVDALATVEKSLEIAQEARNRQEERSAYIVSGDIYQAQSKYQEALINFELALAINREIDAKLSAANSLTRIGLIYRLQGKYDEALNSYEEALTLYQASDHKFGEALTLNNIGSVYNFQGHYELALNKFEEALDIRRELGDHKGEGVTLNNIATTYQLQEKFDDALKIYQEVLIIRREWGDKTGESTTVANIGTIYQSLQMHDKALENFEEALAIQQDLGNKLLEAIILNNMGIAFESIERSQDAINKFENASDIFDSLRATSGNDEARANFISQYVSSYNHLLNLYLQEEMLAKAFDVSEQGRARSFNDALTTGSVQLSDNESAPLIAAEQTTYNKVIAAQDALAGASALIPPEPELITVLEAQLVSAETAHDEALAVIASRNDQLAALVPGRQSVSSLTDVQAMVNLQTTLVSFWVLKERTIAFILTADSFEVVSLDEAPADVLNTQVNAFHDFVEVDSPHPGTASALYNTLIAPIRSYLNTPHLIIVPHQALHYVPFAALGDGEHYLMDDFAITYLPNASMLQYLPEASTEATFDTALIVGNPAAVASDDFGNPLPSLPTAENTAKTVAELFGTSPLLGDTAREAVIYENVSEANVLHLGAHASFNTVAPLQSAIYLTPGDDETNVGDNGRLHVDEIYGLPMDNMELVVLSACETNLGYLDRDNPLNNITAGDEIVSLNRAFLFQSPTVISTLWTVDDAATGLLMEQFYTYLLGGKSKADSLRLAQLDVRDHGDGEYANPYYWAGFVLSGDGGEIEFSALPMATSTAPVETKIPVSEMGTAMQEATEPPSSSGSGGICPGAILPLALMALIFSRKKKPLP